MKTLIEDSVKIKKQQELVDKMSLTNWLRKLILKPRGSPLIYALLMSALACSCLLQASASEQTEVDIGSQTSTGGNMNSNNNFDQVASSAGGLTNVPSNHRMELTGEQQAASPSSRATTRPSGASARQSRQYDSQLGASSSGSYAAISGDGAAYVAQMPVSGSSANYLGSGSSVASNYANEALSSAYHDPLSISARGYSAPPLSGPMHHHHQTGAYPSGIGSSLFPSGVQYGSGGTGGLLASSMFPLMSKGFDLSEIVCTAIAVAIGAVIVGAPFILIYLFIMNQMNGGGGPSIGPSGGSISLTGPNASTTVSGRKKRHTSLPEALFKQLSPLVNNEQVANTFKALMSSIAKYQM